jgi:hypothetical protein
MRPGRENVIAHPSSVLGFVERLGEAVCRHLRGGNVRELDLPSLTASFM